MSESPAIVDILLWHAAGNVVLVSPIALVAWWIQAKLERPLVAHLIWLLVLVKLVTPTLMSIPLSMSRTAEPEAFVASSSAPVSAALPLSWGSVVLSIWAAGSAVIVVWSICRIARFNRLLKMSSVEADEALIRAGDRLARRLGLKRAPAVLTTSANVSPMVWWIGGRAEVYLPASLASHKNPRSLDLILAHELAHIRRRDHFVRWLEWAVCVLFWWNPIAWWARCNLRRTEELCCDALVLSTLEVGGRVYAHSLLSTLEAISRPVARPPAVASEITGGGLMERRIKMIVSKTSMAVAPRWIRNTVLLGAAALLPLGFSAAQDADDFSKVEDWLESGVNSAFITQEQKDVMLKALYRDAKADAVYAAGVVDRDQVVRRERALKELAQVLEYQVATGQLTPDDAKQRLTVAQEEVRADLERAHAGAIQEAIRAESSEPR